MFTHLSSHLSKLQAKLKRQEKNIETTKAEINEVADAINKLSGQTELPIGKK